MPSTLALHLAPPRQLYRLPTYAATPPLSLLASYDYTDYPCPAPRPPYLPYILYLPSST